MMTGREADDEVTERYSNEREADDGIPERHSNEREFAASQRDPTPHRQSREATEVTPPPSAEGIPPPSLSRSSSDDEVAQLNRLMLGAHAFEQYPDLEPSQESWQDSPAGRRNIPYAAELGLLSGPQAPSSADDDNEVARLNRAMRGAHISGLYPDLEPGPFGQDAWEISPARGQEIPYAAELGLEAGPADRAGSDEGQDAVLAMLGAARTPSVAMGPGNADDDGSSDGNPGFFGISPEAIAAAIAASSSRLPPSMSLHNTSSQQRRQRTVVARAADEQKIPAVSKVKQDDAVEEEGADRSGGPSVTKVLGDDTGRASSTDDRSNIDIEEDSNGHAEVSVVAHPATATADDCNTMTTSATASEEVFAQATLVDESPILVYEASEIHSLKKPFCSMVLCGVKLQRRHNLLSLALLAIAVIVGIAVGLAVGSGGASDTPYAVDLEKQPSEPPMPAKTPTPTPAPIPPQTNFTFGDPRADAIAQVIVQDVSGPVALQKFTPQYQALMWVIEEDPMHHDATSPTLVQRYVLMILFFALGGDDWFKKTGYRTGGDECDWASVKCNSDGFVRALTMDFNNMQGPALPEEVASLSTLEILSMFTNYIGGSLPTVLGKLEHLKRLDLYKNSFTGTIPTEIGRLGNLELLRLRQNIISGFIPTEIGNLRNLVSLDLAQNRHTGSPGGVTGTIPASVWQMPSLQRLVLGFNKINGTIAPEIENCQSIKVLGLNNNHLSGVVPSQIGSLSTLERLELQNNEFSGTVPSSLGSLTNLDVLLLFRNNFIGDVPEALCNLTLSKMASDCRDPNPEVNCSCCTECCSDTSTVARLGALC